MRLSLPAPAAWLFLILGLRLVLAPAMAAAVPADIARFLEAYNRLYQPLATASSEASWAAATDVTPENTGRRIGADQALSAFVGSAYVIEQCRAFLARTNEYDDLTRRQLAMIYLRAANAPGTIPDIVGRRVTAEARQSATLDGFAFQWTPPGSDKPEPIRVNRIDDLLANSTNLAERLAVWKASKESGVALKSGLLELRDLRNRVAREMGYRSFYALQVADYGMTVAEMRALTEDLVRQARPLYEQLHCWARHQLAARYGQPVPRLIPAHWLGNRWGQEWPGLVAAADLDPLFRRVTPGWIVTNAVAYGESLGLPAVPASFWTKSDLYELPPGSARKKNTHASAWDINLDGDVRSLMSVKADFQWFETTHHELGHIFYDLSYRRPGVPYVLREAACPAFHEAMAEALATPTIQLPYLRQLGVVPADLRMDETQWLLDSALNQIVRVPWAAGVMAAWEHDFYEENLPADQLNRRWWQHVERYQGMAPPEPRGENYCDAATKTHINDDPAEYYKYAIAYAIKYQLHMHIAKKLLKQDPRNSNFYGNRQVGEFLHGLMRAGATRDWRTLIREATGEDLSARAMLEYYEPLMGYLREQNKGRQVGW